MFIRTVFLWCLLVMTGCAVTDRTLIVDRQGVDAVNYETDLQECRDYADQVDVEREVALGAVFGAVSLGAAGAFFGNAEITERALSVGLVSGSVQGAANVIGERNQVIRNCMQTRGYTVFN